MKVYLGNHRRPDGKPQHSVAELIKLLVCSGFASLEVVYELPPPHEPCLFIENFSSNFLDEVLFKWLIQSRHACLLLTEHFYVNDGLIFYNGQYIFSEAADLSYMSNAAERVINLLQIAPLFKKIYSHWSTPNPLLSGSLLLRNIEDIGPTEEYLRQLSGKNVVDERKLLFFGKITNFRKTILDDLRARGYVISILENAESTDVDKEIKKGFLPIHIPISENSAPFSPTRAFTAWANGSKILQPNGLLHNAGWAKFRNGFLFSDDFDVILRRHNYKWPLRGEQWVTRADPSIKLTIVSVGSLEMAIVVGGDLRIPLDSPLSFKDRLASIISKLPLNARHLIKKDETVLHKQLRKISRVLAKIMPLRVYLKIWRLSYNMYNKL